MDNLNADLLILGAGPAGLTAAQYGARANLKVLAIEQLAPGGQALLIDKLENYPGNIGGKSGFEISQDMHRQAEFFGAVFRTETAAALVKEGEVFKTTLENNEILRSLAVIIATGSKYRTLDIPGEKEFYGRGVSYCAACDGPFFKNKKIFVVGGGDAACDEAQFLSRLSEQVVLIHRKDRFRAQKALAERVLHNPGIETRFNTRMLEIRGQGKVTSVVLEHTGTGKTHEEGADGVFIFVGAHPQSPLVSGVEKDENGYIVTNQNMETPIPGLFAAGDVRASPFRQVVVAAGEGAIAAHRVAGYIDMIKGAAYS
ncbi:MAG: thioredoxin-disulfide reductase [Spirochaetaceae bacterium]|jgi:thioredoxin reductase (NADPH)|nr:thioredoxin-disulfide reductase [Spirochaetaceae bacterium]